MVVSQNWGYNFEGPLNKDHSILGSLLGSPILGNYLVGVAENWRVDTLGVQCGRPSRTNSFV